MTKGLGAAVGHENDCVASKSSGNVVLWPNPNLRGVLLYLSCRNMNSFVKKKNLRKTLALRLEEENF